MALTRLQFDTLPGAVSAIREFNPVITANVTISANVNAMSVGPITIANGYAVTVPTGQRWVII